MCIITIGSGLIFRLFLRLSDTESEVIYFCLVDDHDLQTVSHCYFLCNSCQWLLVTSRGSQMRFYTTGVIFSIGVTTKLCKQFPEITPEPLQNKFMGKMSYSYWTTIKMSFKNVASPFFIWSLSLKFIDFLMAPLTKMASRKLLKH